jgi:hypothetical protein
MISFHFVIGYLGQFSVLAWILLFGGLFWAFVKCKTTCGRVAGVVIVLGVFAAFPGRWAWIVQKRVERHETAEAMFRERCKKAGEFIHRTAENVEGIFLLKLRPDDINYRDQYRMDDPYGRDLGGEGYIKSFIQGNYDTMRPKETRPGWPLRIGYRYVDASDPKDGQRYRHTGRIDEPWKQNPHALKGRRVFVHEKVLAPDPAPRFGVTYDDISTREERDYWIAGSSLKVIDLETNEVMAERIGYMMDRGQGNDSGGRSPWLFAADNACPDFHRYPNPVVAVPGSSAQIRQAQDFVEKVLKPTMEK